MDVRPIGVFDSGAGGLTVLHECLVTMPHEDFVYLGDAARCPYGPRPLREIRRFAVELAAHLEDRGVKLVVAACNSAAAAALPLLRRELAVPVIGALDGDAQAAIDATRNGRIGVLATEATIASGRHADAVHALAPSATVVGVACPRLVPLIEIGANGDELQSAVRAYTGRLREEEVDTAILGCTHYPLVRPVFQRALGRGTTLISSGEETARAVAETLEREGLENGRGRLGACTFATTGSPHRFRAIGERFLHLPIEAVEHVALADLDRRRAPAPRVRADGGDARRGPLRATVSPALDAL